MSKKNKKEQHSVTSFKDDWFTKFTWLKKVNNPRKAYCIVCASTFDVANGGYSALVSHDNGGGHIKLVTKQKENRIGTYFNKGSSSTASPSTSTSPDTQVASTAKPPSYIISDDVLEAEIVWCLHMVQSHLSYRSCDPMQSIFKRMFKTDPVAQGFQMMKDKSRYLIIYGIFPALKEELISRIKTSPWYSVSFDESLNHQQQKCQMDVNVRYWDNAKHIAQSSYYDSKIFIQT